VHFAAGPLAFVNRRFPSSGHPHCPAPATPRPRPSHPCRAAPSHPCRASTGYPATPPPATLLPRLRLPPLPRLRPPLLPRLRQPRCPASGNPRRPASSNPCSPASGHPFCSPPTSPPPSPANPPPASRPPSSPSGSPPPPPSGQTPPSPPPPRTLSPPPPRTPSPPSPKTPTAPSALSPSSSSSSSVSTPLVVGIAVGGVVILLLLSLVCVCCWKKKRRPPPPPPHYYGAAPLPPHAGKDDRYGEHWQQNAPPPADHVVKLPPGPPPPPPFASRPPHSPGHLPPPPPPMISSSGGSGSNYSGSEVPLPPSPGGALGLSRSTFTYEQLVMATDGFSDANLLGQGGFGYVHRGVLPNGKEVAVKQLKIGSGQGEREFQAEVDIISRVHHKHLVTLVGYCISGGKRLLVYEYVPNNTLEFHLHGRDRPTMEWSTRLKIALGSAKGLAYLHEDCHPKIIHRDIKAANILLDYKFEPKVADFGLAKFASDNNTHVSTRVMGTFGYLAPEYASSGKLTDKSDVFSFGVMLLELITGRRPVDSSQTFMDDSLVDWARPLLTRALEDGNYDALVDPKLGRNFDPNEMACMIACAAASVRHSARRRPRMSQVL
ncbi:unnamed protein product, partial [Musa acuminata subsp. burmannicoides]